jgi:type I restriction enzyme S subunit
MAEMETKIKVAERSRSYERYKDSGVEWLGEIPEHWEVKKLKHILKFTTGGTPSSHESGLYDGNEPWVTISDMEGRYITKSHFISKKGVKSAGIPLTPKDSLLYSFKLSVGQVAFSKINLYTNEAIASFHPTDNVCLNYWFYNLPSFIVKNANTNIYGAYILNQFLIKNSMLLVPPLKEQTAIAQFLDDKTTKLEDAINIKEQQISLLKERKQILIHKAVTQGLNPNVKLKASGVDWIGKIPEHWGLSRLKNHINMITGFPFKSEKYTEEGIKLARGINVKEGVLNWKDTRCWPTVEEHLVDYLLADGDVLIAMDGSKVGKNFCQIKESDLPILLLQRVARLRPKKLLISNFLYNHIVNRNFLQWVEMTKTDPMVPHIAPADIKNFQITIPPLSEQKEVSAYIESASQKIETAISLKQQEIAKLKEYKSSLINGVVTGKVKVC